jgi:hypothetical protein
MMLPLLNPRWITLPWKTLTIIRVILIYNIPADPPDPQDPPNPPDPPDPPESKIRRIRRIYLGKFLFVKYISILLENGWSDLLRSINFLVSEP